MYRRVEKRIPLKHVFGVSFHMISRKTNPENQLQGESE